MLRKNNAFAVDLAAMSKPEVRVEGRLSLVEMRLHPPAVKYQEIAYIYLFPARLVQEDEQPPRAADPEGEEEQVELDEAALLEQLGELEVRNRNYICAWCQYRSPGPPRLLDDSCCRCHFPSCHAPVLVGRPRRRPTRKAFRRRI